MDYILTNTAQKICDKSISHIFLINDDIYLYFTA